MSTRRSSGAAAASSAPPASPAKSTRARRGSAQMDTDDDSAEQKSAAATTSSPAKQKRGAKAAAAADDQFAFDLSEGQQAEAAEGAEEESAEMDVTSEQKGAGSHKKRGSAASKKGAGSAAAATAASPSKSPAKKRGGGGRRGSDAAAEYSLDLGGGDSAGVGEHKSSHMSAAESDAFERANLEGGQQSAAAAFARSKSMMAAGHTTKEESDKLMDAEILKQAMTASKDELLKRLKKLSLCLLNQPPRTEVSAKIRALAGALIDRHIVLNKSSEVRAVAACCTADLFRMCAPTSPFTDDQLKVVFDLFLGLLINLSQPTHPDFGRYYYLLESLVKTRFATMLVNKDHLETSIVKLFAIFFKLAPHDLSHHIMSSFVTIMGDVCERLDPFPPALLDEILRQLTREVTTSNPKCSELAIQLLQQEKYRDVFERPIVMWLKDTLVDKLEGDDLSTTITEHEDQLSVLAKLSEFCGDLMTGFQRYSIHLLESADEREREEYTDLWAQVFTSHAFSSQPHQVVKFEPLFDVLMKRFVDVSPKIRAQIARQAGDMLVAHEQILSHAKTILGLLLESMVDREESVRQMAIDSIKSAGLAMGELLSSDVIDAVGARCADKKHSVRMSALYCMAELFSHHCASHWRPGTPMPLHLGIYRAIPKKLIQACKLNRHTSVMVDVLLDEQMLGAEVSVEERTRCLLGIYMGLLFAKKPAPKPLSDAADEDAAARAIAKAEEDQNAARTFRDSILGNKVRLHGHINALLALQSSRASSRSADDQAKFDNDKHTQLMVLAKQLHFEGDATPEDIAQALHAMIFESKDKNITKYLKALSNPVTQYEQIRLAQSGLVQAVKQMPRYADFKNKKGAANLGILSSRLSTMLSLAILPMEAVEMIYSEMANYSPKRAAIFTACQEMLILIGQTFPALLSHPHTSEALLQHLQLGLEKHDSKQGEGIIRHTMQILTSIKDLKSFHADKKQANEFLVQLQELALNGSEAQTALAVECIQHLWGQPHGMAELTAIQQARGDVTAEPADDTDSILAEIFSAHCKQNLTLSSDRLPAALSCCAKIIEVNFPLFMKRTADRSTLLKFLLHELMPAQDIVGLRGARAAGILLVQQYLACFAHSHRALDVIVGSGSGAESAVSSPKKRAAGVKDDSAIQPRNWLIILLKIIKLDGRFPDLTGTTKEMLERIAGQEEDEEQEQARHEFLLNAAYALLELCTVSLYHKFFFHAPSHAAPAAAAGAGGPLSPGAAAPKERHQFQFLTLAYLARHSHGEIGHQFVERVMSLMSRSTNSLPFPQWAAVVVLGSANAEKIIRARVEHFLEYHVRRRRLYAVTMQPRIEAQQAASAPAPEEETSKAKKKKGRKSKSAEEEAEDMIDVEAADRRTVRVACGLFPEYALLDLIYILSYDPDFQDRLPVAPTDEDRDRVFAVYDRMLGVIDFFLNSLMHVSGNAQDPPEQGGGHFNLVFSMLTRLRGVVDARNPDNTKIQKLGELALLSLQERSALQKWSDQKWESGQLSSNLFRPRTATELASKDKYLPQAYHPRVRVHVHGKEKAEGAEGSTPKRKRKSGAAAEGGESTPKSASKRRSKKIADHEGSEGSEDESAASGSTPKKARVSSSAKKAKAKKEPKEESTPTRTTHARGAKAKEIKYEEGEEEEEEEEEAQTAPTKQRSRAKAAAAAPASDEEEEASAAEEEEEEDIDMTKQSRGGKKTKAASSPASSRKKAAASPAVAMSDEEEADEEEATPSKRGGGGRKKAATSPASKPSGGGGGSKKQSGKKDAKQPGIKGFLSGGQ